MSSAEPSGTWNLGWLVLTVLVAVVAFAVTMTTWTLVVGAFGRDLAAVGPIRLLAEAVATLAFVGTFVASFALYHHLLLRDDVDTERAQTAVEHTVGWLLLSVVVAFVVAGGVSNVLGPSSTGNTVGVTAFVVTLLASLSMFFRRRQAEQRRCSDRAKRHASQSRRYSVAVTREVHQPGIEPGSLAWKAKVLPLDHRCAVFAFEQSHRGAQNTSEFRRPATSRAPSLVTKSTAEVPARVRVPGSLRLAGARTGRRGMRRRGRRVEPCARAQRGTRFPHQRVCASIGSQSRLMGFTVHSP